MCIESTRFESSRLVATRLDYDFRFEDLVRLDSTRDFKVFLLIFSDFCRKLFWLINLNFFVGMAHLESLDANQLVVGLKNGEIILVTAKEASIKKSSQVLLRHDST